MIETNFQYTEIGKVPKDWEVISISDKGSLLKASVNPQMYPDRIFVEYSMPSFDNGKYAEIKQGKEMQSNRTYISGPVLLFNKLNVRQRRIWYVHFTDKNSVCSMEFLPYVSKDLSLPLLRYILDTDKITQDFVGMSRGTSNSQKRIAPTDFLSYKIAIPRNVTEQDHIAKVLSSIDSLISQLEVLIEKKKAIRQGAMQELLTGKKRLKGFTEPWVEKVIGTIGYTYGGLTGKTKNDFGVGHSNYISFLNVLNNPIINTRILEKVKVNIGENQNIVKKGDVFFNTSSETPEEVGICSVLMDNCENTFLNSFCFGFRLTDKDVCGLFLSYYFRSRQGRELMISLAQGATRYNLSKDNFNKSVIRIPSTNEEQAAIASVITMMYNDILCLETKRSKYIAIKQGMMQQLLTGKIRLI